MGFNCLKATEHHEEAVYFLPLSSPKFQVLIWLTSERWKVELEPPTGFEHGPLDWESRPLNTISLFQICKKT